MTTTADTRDDGRPAEIVFEHVPMSDLPAHWRARFAPLVDAMFTVHLQQEVPGTPDESFVTDDPAFGIWRDRHDLIRR